MKTVSIVKVVSRPIHLAWTVSRRRTVTAIGSVVVSRLQPALIAVLVGRLIDGITKSDWRICTTALITIACLIGLSRVAATAGTVFSVRLGEEAAAKVDSALLAHERSAPTIAHYDDPQYREAVDLALASRSALGSAVPVAVLVVADFAAVLFSTATLLRVAPMAALCVPAVVAQLALRARSERQALEGRRSLAELERDVERDLDLAIDATTADETHSGPIAEFIQDRLRTNQTRLRGQRLVIARRQYSAKLLGDSAWTTARTLALASALAIGLSTDGLATAILIVGQIAVAAQSLSSTARNVSVVGELFSNIDRVGDLLTPDRAQEPSQPASADTVLQFDNVSFAYPGSPDLLSNISFDVHAGEVVALVGDNGTGKSTIARIAVGLYTPTQGSARTTPRYTGKLQDPVDWPISVRDLVCLGTDDVTDSDVDSALELSGLSQVVGRLADGVNTPAARELSGESLSGGERQRLAIARLHLASRSADLIVIDEPEAGLDPSARLALVDTTTALAERASKSGSGVLLITHDPLLASHADRRYRIRHGSLIEEDAKTSGHETKGTSLPPWSAH